MTYLDKIAAVMLPEAFVLMFSRSIWAKSGTQNICDI